MINIAFTHAEGAYYYTIFNMAAVLVGIVGAGFAAKKNKINVREFGVIVASGILFLIIGSKLVLLDNTQWFSLLTEGTLPLHNGKSVVGAILGGIIGVWGASKMLGNKGSVLDVGAISFPLAVAVHRIGCLLAGCCHGHITSMPWGITYGQGSKPFAEHYQLGMLPEDAMTSMAIHPVQIYNILACILIAVIAWKMSHLWKSPAGKFIFSVLLYLGFRFIEEFARVNVQPANLFGLYGIQWKILGIIILLSALLYFRERSYRKEFLPAVQLANPANHFRILLISVMILLITFNIGGWLTADERNIIIIAVLPLCAFVMVEMAIRTILSQKYIGASSLVLSALIFMSQKADKPDKPMVTPESYTGINITTGAGQFNLDHEFNYGAYPGGECEGATSDHVLYKNQYKIGGIGISRKVYYDQWRSLLASLNVYGGKNKQTVLQNPNPNFTAPEFNSTIVSINPMIQYDMRWIGFGLGGSFGLLGYDIKDDVTDHRDYNPETEVRKSSVQTRLRLFSERYAFIEYLGGYDLGSAGDYNSQLLFGSRFNGNKVMLKGGFAWSRNDGKSIVMHGQVRLSPRFYVSPQLMINYDTNDGLYRRNGHRVGIGIEYRINDK